MPKTPFFRVVDNIGGAVLIGSCIIFRPFFRHWYSKWGATPEELAGTFPGDEYVPSPRAGFTQAITIAAPAGTVWSLLIQTGQNKGGFYSYELLENLSGCHIHGVENIVPEFQTIKIGDRVVIHPKAPAMPVALVRPGEVLVLGGRVDEHSGSVGIFALFEEGNSTRLISRWSFDYKPGFANKAANNFLLEPISAVMQRKMLINIKRLAESLAKCSSTDS